MLLPLASVPETGEPASVGPAPPPSPDVGPTPPEPGAPAPPWPLIPSPPLPSPPPPPADEQASISTNAEIAAMPPAGWIASRVTFLTRTRRKGCADASVLRPVSTPNLLERTGPRPRQGP